MRISRNCLGASVNSRNISIDALKAVCAFLVICIHAPFPTTLGEYITAISRIAVPVFFIISGFYYRYDKSKHQIRKILMLFCFSNILYFSYYLLISVLRGNLFSYLEDTFCFSNLLNFVFFNDSLFQSHLWYLGAILYTLLFVSVLIYFKDRFGFNTIIQRVLYCFIPVLLICDLLFGKYSLLILQVSIPHIWVRNWLFVGLPYFSIGMLIRKNEEWIIKHVNYSVVFLFLIIGCIGTILEKSILVYIGKNAIRDHYLSTTILAVSVFIFFVFMMVSKLLKLSYVGEHFSTWIYVLHPIVLDIINLITKRFGALFNNCFNWVRPLIVYFATILLIALINKMHILIAKYTINSQY